MNIIKLFLAALAALLSGCGGTTFNSPYGGLRITSDLFVTAPVCQERHKVAGYGAGTDCQSEYNREVGRMVDQRNQAVNERAQRAYLDAYEHTNYDRTRRQIVSTVNCRTKYASSYEELAGCRDGRLAGERKALDNMRGQVISEEEQRNRGYGAGAARGLLQ